MGGSGNSSRTPSKGEGVKPATIVGDTVSTGEREPGEKRERGEGTKKPELHQSPETLAQKAKDLAQKREIKGMSSEKRVEHFANKTMFDRFNKQQWNKSEKQIGHDATHALWHGTGKGQGKYGKLKAQWSKGGKKAWISSNKKAAAIIRDKARREEAWKSGKSKRQFGM